LADSYSTDGFRVIALAYKEIKTQANIRTKDESDMILLGFLAFFDPIKESAASAVTELKRHGVDVKVLTGDNEIVTKTICRLAGLSVANSLSGEQIADLSERKLKLAAEQTSSFITRTCR